MPLGTDLGLGPGHIVLDMGTQLPISKKGAQPQFTADVCCGQTAGWIKMPLGTMVGLGPGNIVLDADPAPPQVAQPPISLMYVVANGWVDQDATWYEAW